MSAKRLAQLYLGLAGFGISLALMVRARLGLGPWDVLHQGIARHLGVQLGWVSIGVSVLVLLAWIPLRQRPGLGTISNAVVVGLVVNGALDVLPAPRALAWRIAWLAAGIGLNAVATACYIGAGLGPGPRDGLMTGLAARGYSLRVVRTLIELTVLAIGITLGGSFGPGTVAYALAIGPLTQILLPRLTARRQPDDNEKGITPAMTSPTTSTTTSPTPSTAPTPTSSPTPSLIFGIGIPASAGPGDDPVALAREAERLGYDFVSAADHPGGADPSYDTPTMLTWIAARTSRIKVASRVLAVPFRRPAMVAKLAASLDQLSGGRVILGLGAAYSDQEIAAVGGPARSPAEKIDALAEAIQVIRGAWTCPGFTQDGRYYSVRDLEMAPRPEPSVPIWLGTFGPRALAVTGRLADGWIPSLGYRPVEEFPAMRRRIDEAALAAGRKPDEIRGILNLTLRLDPGAEPGHDTVSGSAGPVVDQLRDLLGLGFTGFNFGIGGPDRVAAMTQVAEEVLPALRSATPAAS